MSEIDRLCQVVAEQEVVIGELRGRLREVRVEAAEETRERCALAVDGCPTTNVGHMQGYGEMTYPDSVQRAIRALPLPGDAAVEARGG